MYGNSGLMIGLNQKISKLENIIFKLKTGEELSEKENEIITEIINKKSPPEN